MLNNVVLVGRMTKDPELRYTPNNQAVATFTWQSIPAISKAKMESVKQISSIV